MSEQISNPDSGRAANKMPFHKYKAFAPIDLPDRQKQQRNDQILLASLTLLLLPV